MSLIHPSAIIDPSAELGQNVEIGPYSVVGPGCRIGDGTRLASHVVLERDTTLGKNCVLASGAVLGGDPQDHNYKNEPSAVEIGNNAVIREYVTINRATGEGNITRVGDDCMIMAYAHLAHNVQLGNKVILANCVQLAGYVEVGDGVFISSTCLLHQFVKIGRLAIVAGFSGSRQDVPPFAMADGRPVAVVGINRVGIKRAGFTLEQRNHLRQAFSLLFFSNLNQQDAIAAVREKIVDDANVDELIDFVISSKRGIHRPSEEAMQRFRPGSHVSGEDAEVSAPEASEVSS